MRPLPRVMNLIRRDRGKISSTALEPTTLRIRYAHQRIFAKFSLACIIGLSVAVTNQAVSTASPTVSASVHAKHVTHHRRVALARPAIHTKLVSKVSHTKKPKHTKKATHVKRAT